jgi:hypothetical protein
MITNQTGYYWYTMTECQFIFISVNSSSLKLMKNTTENINSFYRIKWYTIAEMGGTLYAGMGGTL